MSAFTSLLRNNHNCRVTWAGQVVSEIGDHFNNIAVMSLAMEHPQPGLVVTGVFLARAVPMLAAGPIAGVLLDRLDRKRVMIASDLIRAVVALGFILCIHQQSTGLLLRPQRHSDVRLAVLHQRTVVDPAHHRDARRAAHGQHNDADHVMGGHYHWRVSRRGGDSRRLSSGVSVQRAEAEGGFGAARDEHREKESAIFQYREGLRYMRGTPLVAGVAMLSAGWASGGGAAQILFSLFGEKVFNRGAWGIGIIWGWAGIGLLIGASVAYRLGKRLNFESYKRTIPIVYLIHGIAYILFSQMPAFWLACFFIMISRAGIAVSSVLNYSQLLHHVEDRYRGRVFATLESITWSVMMLSMMAAGAASTVYNPRVIGAWSGAISASTAFFWMWANWSERLPEPVRQSVPAAIEEEVHAELPVTS